MIADVREMLFGLGILLLSFALETDASSEEVCHFDGRDYRPGESWHPYLEPEGTMYCIVCTCLEKAKVNCNQMKCPVLNCPNPVRDLHQCCSRCPVDPQTSPGIQPRVNTSCQYNGTTYQHGDIFTSSELFPSKRANQQFLRDPSRRASAVKQRCACVYNGRTYSHGEVWHPTFRSFLPLPCILCTCKDGRQDCQRITCPDEFACAAPVRAEGKCCRVCPEDMVHPANAIDTTSCRVSIYMFVPSSSENPKDSLRKIAIERESSADVEIYSWKQVNEIFHLVKIQKINKQEFRQEMQNFRLISRTNEGIYNTTEVSEMIVIRLGPSWSLPTFDPTEQEFGEGAVNFMGQKHGQEREAGIASKLPA
ncbi:hypothetical protein lerEdw1_005826 [Lerista edwardsae]|nr:hypothetical protein lerEdw1_005826 [Lerista edwardsae]